MNETPKSGPVHDDAAASDPPEGTGPVHEHADVDTLKVGLLALLGRLDVRGGDLPAGPATNYLLELVPLVLLLWSRVADLETQHDEQLNELLQLATGRDADRDRAIAPLLELPSFHGMLEHQAELMRSTLESQRAAARLDSFAGAALIGIVSTPDRPAYASDAAREAWDLAEAMMSERFRRFGAPDVLGSASDA